jgi:hypothetical protein
VDKRRAPVLWPIMGRIWSCKAAKGEHSEKSYSLARALRSASRNLCPGGQVCGENGSLNVKKFMMAVNWAKCRNRRSEMNARWQCCEENVIPTVFKHLEMIQRMKPIKIRFEFYHDRMVEASLDCVHFTVNEFRDEPSAAHYDHKSASCGVVSDVVC